jgi:hypothetical protein
MVDIWCLLQAGHVCVYKADKDDAKPDKVLLAQVRVNSFRSITIIYTMTTNRDLHLTFTISTTSTTNSIVSTHRITEMFFETLCMQDSAPGRRPIDALWWYYTQTDKGDGHQVLLQ